ncbi:unnamed protein product [Prunus armeniaca]|uniref:RAVE complex protein Rav1 C-terminal domain-containing protein n=1 Tax=Prunus armeniaca TaxID=36596 RepID=A0A6J5WJW4_PRUAR|nr:unnamed protein product [Prunus armeniaca]CAB4300623.1 unnamed protein product [Prunus armeniaca]
MHVLMGRHKPELAIAFFLFGGDTSSAVNICAKNLADEQLALVICRLVEGRGGLLERHLITKFMLPFAIEKDGLASLLEWELGNYSQSLIRMLGFQINSATEKHALSSNGVASLSAIGVIRCAPYGVWVLGILIEPPKGMPIGCAYSNVESSPINSFNCIQAGIAFGSSEASTCVKEYENHEYVKVLESFQQKLYTVVHLLEQKFSVVPFHLISLILISLHNRGLWFIGFDILHGYTSQHHELDKSQTVERFLSYALMHEPLLKATRKTSLLFSRVIAACSITCSILKSHYIENNVSGDSRSMRSDSLGYYFQGLTLSLWSLRAALIMPFEDLTMKARAIIDLI